MYRVKIGWKLEKEQRKRNTKKYNIYSVTLYKIFS